MDRKSLLKMMIGNGNNFLVLLMLAFCFFALLPAAKAQQPLVQCEPGAFYYGDLNPGTVQIGTDCSRLAAIITETDNGVTFTVCGVAPFIFDVVEFGVYYDTAKYFLSDPTFTEKIDCYGVLNSCESSFSNAITIGDVLSTNFKIGFATKHLKACDEISFDCNPMENDKSPVKGMAAFSAELGLKDFEQMPPYEYSIGGGMVDLFTFYLKKVNPGALLNISTDIGIGAFANTTGIGFSPLWMYSAGSVTYYEVNSTETEYVKGPALFLFRAPASIKAVSAATAGLQATLTGHYDRMSRPITTGILDGVDEDFEVLSTNGRLNWDNITRYGFIYAEDRAVTSLTIDKYSRRLIINGAQADCDFPTQTSGSFSCTANGTPYTFYIVEGTNATLTDPSDDYTCQVTGEEGIEYRAWPFLTYTFESSSEFALVGDLLDFEVKDEPVICNISVGTIQVITPPDCNGHYGTIRVYADGATNYEYSLDGSVWEPFSISNSNYTNISLYAGTYRIYVRDADETACVVISEPVTLENSNSDLRITTSATMASTCTDEDGQIAFTVTGGTTQYSYTLTKDGVTTQPAPTASPITDLGTGVYILTVTDGQGCTASSGEIRINSKAGLGVTRSAISHTTCGDATGSFALTINPGSAAPYTYQIDGGAVLSTTETTIMAANLSAGNHVWWVRDAEGCYAEGREVITNSGNDAFTVEVMTTDAPCGSDDGSITLTVTGGTPDFSYDFGGGTQPFATGSRTITFAAPQGVYDIIITNDAGCSYEYQNAVVGKSNSDLAVGTVQVVQQSTCGQSNGSILAYASGGSGLYEYRLSDNSGWEGNSNGPISIGALGTGTYRIQVRDKNNPSCGVAISEPVTLENSGSDLRLEASGSTTTVCGANDGTITFTTTGGTAPYTYKLIKDGNLISEPTASPITNLTTGLYILAVIDDDGCDATQEVRVGSPTSLPVTTGTITDASVCGASDGSFTLTITGGLAPYTYQIDGRTVMTTNETTIVAVNLSSGSHVWWIKDAQGCYNSGRVMIDNDDDEAFTVEAMTIDIPCGGGFGSITLTTSRSGNYTYTYGSGTGTFTGTETTITGLTVGVYDIVVTDDAGCSYEYQNAVINKTNDSDLAVGTIQVTGQPTCGNEDGTIHVYASGGSGTYSYSLTGSTPWTSFATGESDVEISVGAGTYRVYIQDPTNPSCGVAVSEPVTLENSDSDLRLVASGSTTTVCGANDGTITFTTTGGTAPYSYTLTKGGAAVTLSTPVVSPIPGLTTGLYILTVTDAGGCESTQEVRVGSPTGLPVTTGIIIDASACGVSDGSFTLTITGGLAPYTYQIDGRTVMTTNETTILAANLSSGSHVWWIEDAQGCYNSGRVMIDNDDDEAFTVEVTTTDATCSGAGSITLTVTGGAPDFSYDFGEGPQSFTSGSNTITFAAPQGAYDIKVTTTASACVFEYQNAVVGKDNSSDLAVGTIQVTGQPTCGNEDGTIHVYASGGSGTYSYSLTGSTPWIPFAAGSSDVEISVGAGTYRVYIQDPTNPSCGVAVSEPVTLENSDSDLRLVASGSTTTVCGANDGTITFTTTGGTAPYSYTLTKGGAAVTLSTPVVSPIPGLTTGLYILTVTDAGGCESTQEVRVGSPTGLPVTTGTITDASACGVSDGSFTLTITGGLAPYTYQIDGRTVMTTNETTILAANLSSGSHVWWIEDAQGCYNSGRVMIDNDDDEAFTVEVTTTDATCSGAGSITLTVTGGAPDFSYDFGEGPQSFTSGSNTITFAAPQGAYDIKVTTTASACVFEYQNAVVGKDNSSDLAVGTIQVTGQPTCGNEDGTIHVYASGGSGTYSYSLTGSTPWTSFATGESDVEISVGAGTYRVYIQDPTNPSCGVAVSEPVTLENSDSDLRLVASGSTTTVCGANDGTITFTTTGGTAPYSYTLTKGGVAVTLSTPVVSPIPGLTTGLYILTVTDAGGCESTQEVRVGSPTGLPVTTGTITDASACGVSDGSFTLTITGGLAPYTYQIDGRTVMTTNETTILAANLSSGSHVWWIEDAQGCYNSGRVMIDNDDDEAFTVEVTTTDATCSGAGSITLTVTGGAPDFSYDFGEGPQSFTSGSNTITFAAPQGAYDIKVTTTASACVFEYQNAVVGKDNSSDLAVGTIQVTGQPTCGNEDGTIHVYASGGSGTYSYSLTGSTPWIPFAAGSSDVEISVGAGTYRVYIQDPTNPSCGVAVSEPVTLENSDSDLRLVASGSTTTVCGANDGTITFTTTGGTAPYSYTLTKGGVAVTLSTPVVSPIPGLTTGLYILTVTDAGGCESTQEVRVGSPTGLPVTTGTITDASACGVSDGSFTLTITGGLAPYTYQIDGRTVMTTNETTILAANLSSGSHVWWIEDAQGCYNSGRVMIDNDDDEAFTVEVTTTDATCSGAGSITLTVTGGAPDFSYDFGEGPQSFTSGSNTITFAAPQGAYDIKVTTTASACVFEYQNAVVGKDNSSDLAVGTIQVTGQPTCGNEDGTIHVYASGGSGTYSYSLTGSTPWTSFAAGSSDVEISVGAGTYRVYIQDPTNPSCGVAVSEPVTLENSDSDLRLVASGSTTTVCGANDGTITFTTTGGTAPYSYTLTKGGAAVTLSTPVVSPIPGLTTGLYILTVTDAGGCESTQEVRVGSPTGLPVTTGTITDASACGVSDGSFTLTITGGLAPYTYQIDGRTVMTTNETTILAANLSSGSHVWWIEDAQGCYNSGRVMIDNDDDEAFTVEVTTTDATCSGAGSITLTVTGGAPDFSYDFGEGPQLFATGSNTITFAAPQGAYDIKVTTTASACVFEYQNAVVGKDNSSDLAVGTIQVTGQPTCGNEDGTIHVYASGGSGTYSYSLTGSTPWTSFAAGSSDVEISVGAGTYRVYIQDPTNPSCGVAVSEPVTLENSDSDLRLVASGSTTTVCGANDGTITFTTTGGTAPYSYTLTKGGAAVTLSTPVVSPIPGLTTGLYILTVTDAGGCESTQEVRVGSPTGLPVTTGTITDASACGVSDGSFTLTITGGLAPYTYQIDGRTVMTINETTILAANLSSGSHVWWIEDAQGCYNSGRVMIDNDDDEAFTVEVTTTDATCSGAGSITLTVTGGAPDFSYDFGEGPQLFATGSNTITFAAPQGAYDIKVTTTASACVFEYQNAVVGKDNSSDLAVGTIQVTGQPTCGNEDGTIHVYASGGSGTYSYSLTGSTPWTSFAAGSSDVEISVGAGTYRVYIQDPTNPSCGVAVSEPVTLENSDSDLRLVASGSTTTVCGANDGTITFTTTGGTAPYSYTLTKGGAAVTLSTPVVSPIPGLTTGLYILTVTDAGGCESTQEVRVGSPTGLPVTTGTITDASACGVSDGSFTLTITGGLAPYTYQIDGRTVMTTNETTILAANLSSGSHVWWIEDAQGCYNSGRVMIDNDDDEAFTVEVTTTDATCSGAGSITLTVTGGAPDFSYDFGEGPQLFATGSNTITFAAPQGAYDIKVTTTASACVFEYQNAVVGKDNSSDLAVGTIQVTGQPTCGNEDGTIHVYASGGSGTYSYSLTGSTPWIPFATGSSDVEISVGAGTYRVYIQDPTNPSCGVAVSEPVTLENSDSDLRLVASGSTTTVCGANDGTITFTTTGGTAPYSYTLTKGGAAVTLSTPVVSPIPGLTTGLYILTVTDAGGCESTQEVRVGSPTGLPVTTGTITDASACGVSDGSFTLTITGGLAPYTYQIDGRTVMTTNETTILAANLSSGSHVWWIEDAQGCYNSGRVMIDNDDDEAFTVEVTTTDATCSGAGSITLTVTGGAPDFSYDFGEGPQSFTSGSNTITFAAPQGAYDIKVTTTASACVFEYQNAVVGKDNSSDLAVGTIQVTGQPTCGNEDGTIHVYASGGSGTYSYSLTGSTPWTSFATGESDVEISVGAGTYRVYIQDPTNPSCGVAVSEPVTLENSDSDLRLVASGSTTTVCGANDGTITFTTTGGTAPYSYTLTKGGVAVTLSTPVVSPIPGLTTGLYILTVTDAGGCESTQEVRVGSPTGLPVTTGTITDASACGVSDGSFTLTITGGLAPYTYQIDGHTVMTTNETTILAANLSSGSHVWWIEDAQGCYNSGRVMIDNDDDEAFTVEVTTTDATCSGAGSITLTVTGGAPDFSYDFGEGPQSFTSGSNTITFAAPQGAYDIKVTTTASACVFEYQNAVINNDKTPIAPPRVTTPQTFCTGATVANLQVEGVGIIWYNESGNELLPTEVLTNGAIYYAAQRVNGCESTTRSAVKVIIDNNVFLDAPTLPGIFDICGTGSTLADIPTYGNTNIVWYDSFTGGTKYENPATVTLEDGKSYFAAQSGGGLCVSASRTEVVVTIGDITPVAPDMESPQQFCKGALVGNLAVPNNQIVWYSAAEGGEVLPLTMPLIDGGVYYAAQKAGDCESATRIAVTVELTQYLKPDAMGLICINGMQKLADLPIAGAGIVWYATEDSETPLPLSTAISVGATYWAAQTNGDCESERIAVTLTDDCYNPRGTIFPFVHIGDNDFDNQFVATVKLYSLPPESTLNKINYVRSKSQKLFETLVTYYDETTYIAGTPKYPGVIGFFDNPGNPILWSAINQFGASPNNTAVTDVNDRPMSPIGQFGFENVAAGKYVIEVARQGFLTRYGVVEVGAGKTYLGHREILGGDVNGDLNINDKDLSVIVSKYSTYMQSNYKWPYDINGSSKVGTDDANIIKIYLGTYVGTIYEETYKFLRNDY